MSSDHVSEAQGPPASMMVEFQVLPEFLQGFNLCTRGPALNYWLTKPDNSLAEAYRHTGKWSVGLWEMPVREVTLLLVSIFLVLSLNQKAPQSFLCQHSSFLLIQVPQWEWVIMDSLCPLTQSPTSLSSPSHPGCWDVFLSPYQWQLFLQEWGIFWFPAI